MACMREERMHTFWNEKTEKMKERKKEDTWRCIDTVQLLCLDRQVVL
jgi:hypothetical protein